MILSRTTLFCVLVASALSAYAVCLDGDYSQKSMPALIDELTQIDSATLGTDSNAVYEGFIATDASLSFEFGRLGFDPPKMVPQMQELVRRGPLALPELIRHLDDKRQTKLKVGNLKKKGPFYMFTVFSDEYDSRVPHSLNADETTGPQPMERDFKGGYTVKVGDICYVLIGQIVNRQLVVVRYQPTAGLIVNSPIEAPGLAEKVRGDWGNANAEALKASLLEDIHGTNRPKGMYSLRYKQRFVTPALKRLRFYFPDAYSALQGDDLEKKREFETEENAVRSPKQL
jgi:hypothetical protein